MKIGQPNAFFGVGAAVAIAAEVRHERDNRFAELRFALRRFGMLGMRGRTMNQQNRGAAGDRAAMGHDTAAGVNLCPVPFKHAARRNSMLPPSYGAREISDLVHPLHQ